MTATDPGVAHELASFSWNDLTPEQAREMCRRAQGLSGLAHSDADGGFHLAARHDDVVRVMDDAATFSSFPSVFRPMPPGVPPFPALEYDPPRHGPWREVYRELVNPRTVKRLRAQVLDDVDRHIDAFIGSGTGDLVHDLAEYVPAETICRAAGIDDMDLAGKIRVAALAGVDASGRDPEALPQRLAEFAALVMPLVEQRRVEPRDDFLTRLIATEPEGVPLTHADFVGTLFGLLAAGHHSTTSAMSQLFLDVLTRPEVRQRLAAEPRVVTRVIEESLRIDPPFYGFFRRTTAPVDVSGTELAPEDSVCVGWVGANHDPAQFADPDEFRLDRTTNRHVTFGYGIHTCVGAPLARLELQIALEQVLRRMPDVALVGEPPRKHFGGASATYLESLPVRFTPGAVRGRPASEV